MKPIARTLAILNLLQLFSGAIAGQRVYRNDEYGMTVPIPKSAQLCSFPEDEHDHGPLLILGSDDRTACYDQPHNRYIVVFAGYNAADDTKRLGDFLRWECAEIGGGHCHAAPEGLRIAHMKTRSGRVNRSDGWIDIFVVTQAGKPDPNFDASVPSINYDLRLHTTPRHLGEDLRTFRAVLNTVRLSPPAWNEPAQHRGLGAANRKQLDSLSGCTADSLANVVFAP